MGDVKPMHSKRSKLVGTAVALLTATLWVAGCGSTDPETSPEHVFLEIPVEVSTLLSERFESRMSALRATGGPETVADLEKWFPAPPTGENAAEVFQKAFDHYVYAGERDYENLPIVGQAHLPEPGHPMPASMKAIIGKYLEANDEALRLLHEAGAMQHFRHPIDFAHDLDTTRRGSASLLGYLVKRLLTRRGDAFSSVVELGSGMRQAARLLMLETLLRAEDGDHAATADSIIAALGVWRSYSKEPFVIAQLSRYACQGITVSSFGYVLNRTALPEEPLRRVQNALAAMELPEALPRSMLAEGCIYPETQDDPEFERQMTEQQIVIDAGGVAYVRIAVAAAALERFRLAEGHLPDSLDDLTPTFLDRVPLDPVSYTHLTLPTSDLV